MRTLLLAVALMVGPGIAHEIDNVDHMQTLKSHQIPKPKKELKVEWMGLTILEKECDEDGTNCWKSLNLGLREDGIVVWRKAR